MPFLSGRFCRNGIGLAGTSGNGVFTVPGVRREKAENEVSPLPGGRDCERRDFCKTFQSGGAPVQESEFRFVSGRAIRLRELRVFGAFAYSASFGPLGAGRGSGGNDGKSGRQSPSCRTKVRKLCRIRLCRQRISFAVKTSDVAVGLTGCPGRFPFRERMV